MNQRPNVLLVDDQKLTHAIIGKALANADISLISAHSGREALEIVRQQDVSLVLMDLMMPGMDGIETATCIREILAPRLVPVIFITAASQDEDAVRRAYEMGAVDFLYKPVSPAILKAKVSVFSELHRQRTALERRKEEYRDILEAVATGILAVDLNWHAVEVNDTACAQFQHTRTELLGIQLDRILGAGDRPLSEEISTLLDNSVAFSLRTKGHRQDGSDFHADIRGTTIMLQGAPCVLMCVNDVSSYISGEDDLNDPVSEFTAPVLPTEVENCEATTVGGLSSHSFECCRPLFDAIPTPLYFKDSHGLFLGYNTAFAELFALEGTTIVGKNLHELLDEELAFNFETSDQALLSGYRKSQELIETIPDKHGNLVKAIFHKAAITTDTGSPTGIAGTIFKYPEIEADQKFLESILQGIQAGIVIFNAENGIIESMNSVAETLLEAQAGSMTGRRFEDAVGPLLWCEDSSGCKDVSSAQFWKESEARLKRRDGLNVPILTNAFNVQHDGRSLTVLTLFDISQRKLMEQQLSLAQRLESLGQLATGIAHEINTPIQYIADNIRFFKEASSDLFAITDMIADQDRTGSVDMAQIRQVAEERDYPFLKQEVPQAIRQSLEGVAKVATIVESMKQFSQPGEKDMTPYDINQAVRHTLTISRHEWKHCADVTTDLADNLSAVICDPADINQAILNMVVNAAHAVAERNQKEQRLQGKINLTTKETEGFVEISVSDDGVGIPLDNHTRIFNPFFTTKPVGIGTGQGLALVHAAIVDRHKGQVHVDSRPGAGSTFRILLPVRHSSKKEQP